MYKVYSLSPLALSRSDLDAALESVAVFARSKGATIEVSETRGSKRSVRFNGEPIESWTVALDGATIIIDASGSHRPDGIDESNPLHIALFFATSAVCKSGLGRVRD